MNRHYSFFAVLCLIALAVTGTARAQQNWEYWPGPSAGYNYGSLMADDLGVITLMFDDSYLFRSSDDGATWSRVRGSLPAGASSIGLYCHGAIYIQGNDSLWRSTDGGVSWRAQGYGLYPAPFPTGALRMPVSLFRDSSILLTFLHSFGDYSREQLFRFDVHDGSLREITVDRDTSSHYMMISNPAVTSDGAVYLANIYPDSCSIWRSTNGGETWLQVSNPLPDSLAHEVADIRLVAGAGGYLLASFYSRSFWGFYKSRDSGQTWRQVSIPATSDASPFHSHAMAIDSSGDILVAFSNAVYRSTDRGETWEVKQRGGMNPIGMFVAPSGTIFIMSSTRGIVRSTDGGNNWLEANTGINNVRVPVLLPNWHGRTFAKTYSSNGLLATTDAGRNWDTVHTRYPVGMIMHDSTTLYATSNEGMLLRGADGINWEVARGSLDSGLLAIAVGPDGSILEGSPKGFFRSTDRGDSWSHLGIDRWTVGVLAHPTGTLLALINDGARQRIYYSSSVGALWTEASGIADSDVVQNMTLGSDGTLYGQDHALYRSTNQGRNWQRIPVDYDLTNATMGAGLQGELYVSLSSATVRASRTFRVTERGTRWTPFGDGLDSARVMAFAVDSAGYVYAGTDGHGVARTTIAYPPPVSGVAVSAEQSNRVEVRCVPKPATGDVSIAVTLPNPTRVVLSICGVSGERVATLYDGELPGGTTGFSWQASGYGTGRYRVELVTEDGHIRSDDVVVVR